MVSRIDIIGMQLFMHFAIEYVKNDCDLKKTVEELGRPLYTNKKVVAIIHI